MSSYQTQGIILRKVDFREADQLFYFYTKHLGKAQAVGRGTKKITSKLNSHLQFFSTINLMIAQGKRIDQLAGAIMIKSFNNIKNNFQKIIMSSFGLELVDQLTKVNQPDPNIYDLLVNYLITINQESTTRKDWPNIKSQFVIELMTLLGYGPSPATVDSPAKLNYFLKQHLDQELKVERFFNQ